MDNNSIKVLIVDDSSVSRELLSFIIQSDPALDLIGSATNGEEGVEMALTLEPDVIMMDIVMPKMNGFEATKQIMNTRPVPIIMISGVFNTEEITRSFDAMHAGALTILEKPRGVGDTQYLETARFVIGTIKALSEARKNKKLLSLKTSQTAGSLNVTSEQPIQTLAIGASIGGPQTLASLLSKLPPNFSTPIYIAQHISNGFSEGFANWLDKATSLNVKIPQDGEIGKPGTVYLAPDRFHLSIEADHIIHLIPSDDKVSSQSSINQLFSSIANNFGKHAIGILLTGTGSDGVSGLLTMKNSGAITIVQDPQSAIIGDLPQAAIEADAAQYVESIDKIISSIPRLIQKPVGTKS